MTIRRAHLIFFVSNQRQAAAFYGALLKKNPLLDVPGMTEFELSDQLILGLMPRSGAARLLSLPLQNPEQPGAPTGELYLYCEDPEETFQHAITCGAIAVSEVALRNWGDWAGYVADPDGHVLAFARKN